MDKVTKLKAYYNGVLTEFEIGNSGGGGQADLYVGLNAKGNLEITNNVAGTASDSKVNLVSKTDIQIKPGVGFDVQLDGEALAGADEQEVGIKIANGTFKKANRVIRAKINTAELLIDNQKAHTSQETGTEQSEIFDIDKFKVTFRTDKWNSGQRDGSIKGPVAVNLRAKSFDIRCHGDQPGGGVALQPSGRDNSGKENKIKFESSRTCALDASEITYTTEGGKGLEFGTFNNLHTSLFTGDYRFKGDAPVYGVTRGTPGTEGDKFDYPTQEDDFKDIVNNKIQATRNQIILAASCFTLEPQDNTKIDAITFPKKTSFEKQVAFNAEGDEVKALNTAQDVKFLHRKNTKNNKQKYGQELIKFTVINNHASDAYLADTIEGGTISVPANTESTVGRVLLWDLVQAVHNLSGSTLKYIFHVDSANDFGTVDVAGFYPEGSSVTAVATAIEGHMFTQWSDGDTNATRTFSSLDHDYFAIFE